MNPNKNINIYEPKAAGLHTRPSELHVEGLLLVNRGVLHMKRAEEGKAASPGGRSARPLVDEPALLAGLCGSPNQRVTGLTSMLL